MRNFKNYFFTENVYLDKTAGKLVYKLPLDQNKKLGEADDNEQLVAKEVMLNTTIRGQMSTFIPSKTNKLFIGYDVFTTKEANGKDIRNSVYATVKGTANALRGKEYEKKFQAMPENDYNMLIERAVDAFISKESVPYDFILYPSSRSSNAQDIANLINTKLKQKLSTGVAGQRAQSAVVQEIPKKPITQESIKEVVQIEKLVNNVLAGIESHAGVKLSSNSKNEIKDLLVKTLVDFLTNKVSKFTADDKYSTSSHLKPVPNSTIFDDAIKLLNEPGVIPELENKIANFSVGGHLDSYCDSHFELTDLKTQLSQYDRDGKKRAWIGKTRILIVDDNINSGDMYKQIAPLGDMLRNCDFFFLMKDMKYKV
jgi:hypothetical protein